MEFLIRPITVSIEMQSLFSRPTMVSIEMQSTFFRLLLATDEKLFLFQPAVGYLREAAPSDAQAQSSSGADNPPDQPLPSNIQSTANPTIVFGPLSRIQLQYWIFF